MNERARSADPLDNGLPTGDAKHRAVRQMFDTIAPRYDMVNRLMTFRLDVDEVVARRDGVEHLAHHTVLLCPGGQAAARYGTPRLFLHAAAG